jgi:hypothetical protein
MKYLKKFNEGENNFELQERIKGTERLLNGLGHYKDSDGYWHVGESIRLPKYAAHDGELVVKFWEVRGTFDIQHLDLKSLDGCPKSVYNIYCGNNSLYNLIGSPNEVSFNFSCRSCGLESIEGHPKEIGGHFDIIGNNIKDLTSFSNINCDSIHIYNNPIYSIVESWINIKSERWELIDYFNDMNIIQDTFLEKPKLIIHRLEAFIEDCGIDNYIDNDSFRENVEKYYKIIE